MEQINIIKALSALAHSSRLTIFRALVVAGPNGLTPGDLSHQLGIPPATLSFHLKELVNANLANPQREGRQLFYSAQFEHMNEVIAYLTENCCNGQSCAVPNLNPTCHEADNV